MRLQPRLTQPQLLAPAKALPPLLIRLQAVAPAALLLQAITPLVALTVLLQLRLTLLTRLVRLQRQATQPAITPTALLAAAPRQRLIPIT